MRCLSCGHEDTKVLESRLSGDGRSVRRRRSCLGCNRRFTTYEREEAFAFQVEKKDGRLEPYVREKALRSVQIACQKRPVSMENIEFCVDKIEKNIQEMNVKSISSRVLGNMLLRELFQIDPVAYIRFASVYKEFQDPKEFLQELEGLEEGV